MLVVSTDALFVLELVYSQSIWRGLRKFKPCWLSACLRKVALLLQRSVFPGFNSLKQRESLAAGHVMPLVHSSLSRERYNLYYYGHPILQPEARGSLL